VSRFAEVIPLRGFIVPKRRSATVMAQQRMVNNRRFQSAGKEWWVGKNWGLGVARGFGCHSLPEKNMDENWTGASFGVRFSATLN